MNLRLTRAPGNALHLRVRSSHASSDSYPHQGKKEDPSNNTGYRRRDFDPYGRSRWQRNMGSQSHLGRLEYGCQLDASYCA